LDSKDQNGKGWKEKQAMKLNTYLNYGGNWADAFQFYEKNLGGRILMMMKHGDMPDSGQSSP